MSPLTLKTRSPGMTLHLPHSSEKFSIWFNDNPDTDKYAKFATIRGPTERLEVVPVEWTPRYQRSCRSTAEEKVLYPLDWTVRIGGVAEFEITSVAEDQEIVGSNALETAYEGFVTFKGGFNHHDVTGFGLMEIVYGSWDWL
ncbi:uncharacterized protein LDX57_010569 [Aspergillus melleus]|uniref:uncharacterized protein n=1 Tax=Aspergillus melleus TaxID=138277 RepID=UPI001E8ECCF1|nr:uncharacterized protein LDX57_010569 [Aspergillus melleus]KAH8432936.1 hypothetical protein LDX57_010569 [Aspergillus melleus]